MDISERSVIRLRAGIGDMDLYPEVNNGRQLTLMDLGRIDVAARTGLMRVIRERRWNLVAGGSSIRYRRRLPLWARFTLRTEVIGHDERWFYFLQEMYRGETICSSALIKAGVRNRAGLIAASEVTAAMGRPDWNPPLPDWVIAWIAAEGQRPWPG
jgi:acyl-CoA thioesterase FadM